MTLPVAARRAVLALLAPALSACVANTPQSTSSVAHASLLAGIVSRAAVCKAGYARTGTLDSFLQAERERGATQEQLAAARSAYVSISEAETINQGVRPEPCTAEERTKLRGQMSSVRAGRFDGL
ncbi:hypothetical protein [Bosea sp. CS1GBMeth4]|uniref:hypothetical protein n=1 Tax=Bosea sp. CS1GBMeth4 TaxID=1892849 RepID=UPI00164487CD|nr:hypothetical protein [Bosea sp. CS1GBMeth4]